MNTINNFTFFNNYKEVVEQLKNDEEKQEFIYAIYQFIFFDIEPNFDKNPLQKMGWLGIKSSLETSKNRGLNNKVKKKTKKNQNEIKKETKKIQTPSISISISYSISNNLLEKIEYEKEKPCLSELDNLFNEYIQLRKKEKMSVSDTVLNRLFNKLKPFNNEIKKEIIGNAINGKWKDFYEIDKKKKRVPEWLDKEIKLETNVEDEKILKDLLKDFKEG